MYKTIELSKDRFGETITLTAQNGHCIGSYAERNPSERDTFYFYLNKFFKGDYGELMAKGSVTHPLEVQDCKHIDFRDTLDGGVCNTCGLVLVVEAKQ